MDAVLQHVLPRPRPAATRHGSAPDGLDRGHEEAGEVAGARGAEVQVVEVGLDRADPAAADARGAVAGGRVDDARARAGLDLGLLALEVALGAAFLGDGTPPRQV